MAGRQGKAVQEKMQAALVAMLQERALPEISVTALCRAAQVHRSTFYTYYENLEQILDELESEYMSHIAFLDCHAGETEMIGRVQSFVNYAQSHVPLLRALTKSHRLTDAFFQQSLAFTHQVNKKKGRPDANAREQLLAVYTTAGTMALVKEWLFHCPHYSPEEVTRLIIRLSHSAAVALDLP